MRFFSNLIDKRIAVYQRELIETHYAEVENMYKQIRGWRHDYRNHIQVMKAYASNGDMAAIKKYLDELESDLATVDTVIKTGNPMADAILNSKISLANRVKLLRENLATMVNSNVLISNATSYAQGVDKVANFADKMVQIAGMVGNSSLSDMIKNFASNIPVFFGGNVGILGSAISTLFYTFESVCDTASLLFSSSETLFDFGDTDVKVSPNTPERLEQKKNAGVLNTQIQASALGSAMDAFANTDFENEEDLKIAEDKILNQIDKILNSDTLKDSSLEGVEDIKYYLKQIQVDFSDVIAEKELITPKITTVDVKGESVSLIAYKYYDNIDNAQALIDLNNIQDPKVVNGSIRIFDNVG